RSTMPLTLGAIDTDSLASVSPTASNRLATRPSRAGRTSTRTAGVDVPPLAWALGGPHQDQRSCDNQSPPPMPASAAITLSCATRLCCLIAMGAGFLALHPRA